MWRIAEEEKTVDGDLSAHVVKTSLTQLPAEIDPELAYFANEIVAEAIQEAKGDPTSVRDVQSHFDWPRWKEAMDREMKALEHSSTWHTIKQLQGKNIISCKWVFKLKCKADGSIDKYKACLVASGFTQIHGVDYHETYFPVTWLVTFCSVLGLAAKHGWEIQQFDFNSAFLNGELDDSEELYMPEPLGYKMSGEGSVKQLHKAIYELK